METLLCYSSGSGFMQVSPSAWYTRLPSWSNRFTVGSEHKWYPSYRALFYPLLKKCKTKEKLTKDGHEKHGWRRRKRSSLVIWGNKLVMCTMSSVSNEPEPVFWFAGFFFSPYPFGAHHVPLQPPHIIYSLVTDKGSKGAEHPENMTSRAGFSLPIGWRKQDHNRVVPRFLSWCIAVMEHNWWLPCFSHGQDGINIRSVLYRAHGTNRFCTWGHQG